MNRPIPSGSKGDFVLPGTRDSPTSTGVLIHAVVQAFSSKSNRRRLESHIYALWGEILSCLVGDLHGVIVVPQYKIYNSSEAGAEVDPNSSGYTVPDAAADETTPDFTLLGVILANRQKKVVRVIDHHFSFRDWPTFHIAAWRPFLVLELKRMPSRHIQDIRLFTIELEHLMSEAMHGAHDQARTAFTESACMNPAYSLKKLILIAAAGEWWTFRIMDENSVNLRRKSGNNKINESFDSDEDIHTTTVHTTALKPRSLSTTSKSRTNTGRGKGTGSKDTRTTVHWTKLDKTHKSAVVAELKQNYKNAAPPKNGEWSAFILYDNLALEADTNPHEDEPESEDELDYWVTS
ncbi:hypothetical protein BJ912DRAFT_1152959 [Pholiota molesta]|nr:hypothetical protein BJ912DRAFT_1152959 [Pholiota molesta]